MIPSAITGFAFPAASTVNINVPLSDRS